MYNKNGIKCMSCEKDFLALSHTFKNIVVILVRAFITYDTIDHTS
jgi:hypothetical protein